MADLRTTQLTQKVESLRREGEERAAQRLAKELNLPYLDLSKAPISLEAVKIVPKDKAEAAKLVAIGVKDNKMAVAAVDPRMPATRKAIQEIQAQKHLNDKNYEVKLFVSSFSGIKQAWHYYDFVAKEKESITGKVEIEKQRFEDLTRRWVTLRDFESEMETSDLSKIKTGDLVEIILGEALATKASDVHFEALENGARVRFRIDGILQDVLKGLPSKNYEGLISRIKLLAGLKINVRGTPQDGRFTIEMTSKDIEIRVSIIPSEFGETIVMRILDPESISVGLSDLGLREDDLFLVNKQLESPNGLILNTGPTGSGKTTTLYAFLKEISNPEKKIITIEDPIEYRLEGIEQTQVDPSAEYTFAKGLKAIVRQDPDVILVGEIRDKETAEIAVQAALTGHVVLSTLHTNDAIGAVPRLVDLGVKTTSIGPALSLVIAQRLVRRLCVDCRKLVDLSEEEKEKISKYLDNLPKRVDRKIIGETNQNLNIYEPVGCDKCNHIGYKGRIGVFEFLEAGPEFEETILKEASEVALRNLAKRQEMVTMQQDGVIKVLQGMTSFEEVKSVTGPIDW